MAYLRQVLTKLILRKRKDMRGTRGKIHISLFCMLLMVMGIPSYKEVRPLIQLVETDELFSKRVMSIMVRYTFVIENRYKFSITPLNERFIKEVLQNFFFNFYLNQFKQYEYGKNLFLNVGYK